jgi:hypothetical protein
MQKGSEDNPSKAGPIVMENTYRGLVLGFHRLHLPRASWVWNLLEVLSCISEHFLSISLTGFGLDTLLIVVYLTFDCTRLVSVHALET